MMSNTPDTTIPPVYSEPETALFAPPVSPIPPPPFSAPPPEPTTEQLERREARRRFERNRLFLPMAIVACIWILVTTGMVWLSLAGDWFGLDTNQEFYRLLFNGVANVVVILVIFFWMLLLVVPMGLTVYLWSYRRRQIASRPAGPKSLPFFWRIENIIIQVRDVVDQILPKLARPVILAYGLAAFLKTLFNEIKKFLHLE